MNKAPLLVIVMLVCAATVAADAPPPEKIVPALQELRAELEWPGLTLDEAVANLKTPQEAFRFVRDEIVL
ncbi:MAG: hypothetical protein JXL80_00950, partial [Planctomycetes bacterium]|nr:hypothetical protein [Planctomycetota bacterium]